MTEMPPRKGFWQLPKPVQAAVTIAIILVYYTALSLLYIVPLVLFEGYLSDNSELAGLLLSSNSSYEVEIVSFDLYSGYSSSMYVNTIAKITNTGDTYLYVDDATFDYTDGEGYVIQSNRYVRAYPQIIAPGESAYYIDNSAFDGGGGEVWVTLSEVVKVARKEVIRYEVTNTKMSLDAYGRLKITGKVRNQTSDDEKFAYVAAVIFDYAGNPIAKMFTTVDILAGQSVAFDLREDFLGYDISYDDVGSYIVWAYPYQFQLNRIVNSQKRRSI